MRLSRVLPFAVAVPLAAALLVPVTTRAEQEVPPAWFFRLALSDQRPPTLRAPHRLATKGLKGANPTWTEEGLWAKRPRALWGLAKAEQAGMPTYDVATRSWYASAMGALVRVAPDGSLPVVVQDVQGSDVDVRPEKQVAVSREPKDVIVLHRWGGPAPERKVLFTGPQYFSPRLSPDGAAVLVTQSVGKGSRTWVVPVDGEARDLGEGTWGAWMPDSQRVLLAVVEGDGHQLTASTLFMVDVATGVRTKLARTTAPLVTVPAVSPDGKWMAFVDGRKGTVMVASFPERR
jgi:hypothetical protein